MTIHEIRESGLLELFVLGDLALHERSEVEATIYRYPELKKDLIEIEKVYQTYAEVHAVKAPKGVLERLLLVLTPINSVLNQGASKTEKAPKKSNINRLLTFGLAALLSVFGYYLITSDKNHKKLESDYTQLKSDCDNKNEDLENRLVLYKQLSLPENRAVEARPTDKYPQTKMILNINEVTKRNFIQFKFLPPPGPNQSYQLWSLKGSSDPIPLNVIDDISEILEVDFIDGTNAYAVTIEPKGGGQSPTIVELVGVFSIKG